MEPCCFVWESIEGPHAEPCRILSSVNSPFTGKVFISTPHSQKSCQLVCHPKGGRSSSFPFAKHPPQEISHTFDIQTLCPPHRRPHVRTSTVPSHPQAVCCRLLPPSCLLPRQTACVPDSLANCPPRPLTHPQAVCCRRAVCSHGKLHACQTLWRTVRPAP